jgi:hypothetical protein
MKIAGIILIVLGGLALIWQGFTYTTKEKIVDIGPVEVHKETTKRVPLPPIAAGSALAIGVALLVMGNKK